MNTLLTSLVLAAMAQLAPATPADTPAAGAPAPPLEAAAERAPYPDRMPMDFSPMDFSKTPDGDPMVRATIKAENDIIVPASAEGIIINLPVREGTRVAEGQVLATIDDRQALAGVEVAKLGLEAAVQRASDDIEERYASAAARVARIDWERDMAANRRTPNAVADIQVLQKKLVYDRSVLQKEKAQKDQALAKKEAEVKRAELDAARILLDMREVRAEFAGEVVELVQREGQWVKAGDPILRLVRFDKLWVECFIPASEFDPSELAGRRVSVVANLARGRKASAEGRVVFVDQTVMSNFYRVRAEVDNQRDGDYWLLRPGLDAEITIHASQPPAPVAEPKTARQP
ncbi:MAG TPA: HlyD family efflux transporter periplasmic adaptor subunit [Lacipirellula sp.]